jgi:hypothetical protein
LRPVQRQSVWDICERVSAAKKGSQRKRRRTIQTMEGL